MLIRFDAVIRNAPMFVYAGSVEKATVAWRAQMAREMDKAGEGWPGDAAVYPYDPDQITVLSVEPMVYGA